MWCRQSNMSKLSSALSAEQPNTNIFGAHAAFYTLPTLNSKLILLLPELLAIIDKSTCVQNAWYELWMSTGYSRYSNLRNRLLHKHSLMKSFCLIPPRGFAIFSKAQCKGNVLMYPLALLALVILCDGRNLT